ncbi:hypothetical protein [Pseudophaeobacter flagellatus]|uniref:hypothetical protein n=1 Tax=Pseudophaeobacter flagellatus TaxID=2899119 RepID=UPI001E4AD56B|nr:hypothetical protein [Pseudophaeobacter flagellatus]MCD9147644.1 hypothetical protein [Pseudophaeobacter flagellatus]
MAQIEHYKGRLGFDHRSEATLTLALTELLDTMEEFGHPALQITAREPHRIGLDCDHYRVNLRLRRIPLRLGVRTPKNLPTPAAYIELKMTPSFHQGCDQEITEILLAELLKRLTLALDPLVIFWQETDQALTPKQFLGAFEQVEPLAEPWAEPVLEPDAAQTVEPAALACTQAAPQDDMSSATAEMVQQPLQRTASKPAIVGTDAAHSTTGRAPAGPHASPAADRLWKADKARAEAEAERARGQARFGSPDAVTPELERHLDELQPLPGRARLSRAAKAVPAVAAPQVSYQSVFGKSRFRRLLALPRATVSTLTNGLRGGDLIFSLRAVLTAFVVLFLHGSGMVQAAARAFLPQ